MSEALRPLPLTALNASKVYGVAEVGAAIVASFDYADKAYGTLGYLEPGIGGIAEFYGVVIEKVGDLARSGYERIIEIIGEASSHFCRRRA